MAFHCFHCKKEHSFKDRIGFRDECEHCRTDLHACKNCEFHDAKVYNECRESSADVVREKDRANFCDHFTPRMGLGSAEAEKAKLKAVADALFKKKD
ncbi:MAG: hypothetical protein H7061_07870 [Bdellovibrionaceae bacterium]|nr:hypothetical protein [Bdellovibrio sp.]